MYNILYSSMHVSSAHALSTLIMFDPHVQVHVLIMKYSVITLVCFPNCYHVLNISIILTIPTYIHLHIYVAINRLISISFNINLLMYIATCVFLCTSKQISFAILCFRVRAADNLNLIMFIFFYCYLAFCHMQPALLLCTHLIHNTTVCSCFETTLMWTFIALKHVLCILPELMLYMYMYSLCNEHKLLSCSLIAITIVLHSLNTFVEIVVHSDHTYSHKYNNYVAVPYAMHEVNYMQVNLAYQFKSTCPNNNMLEILSSKHIYLYVTDLFIISLCFYMLCFRLEYVHLWYSLMFIYNVLCHMYVCTYVIDVHIIIHFYNNG